MIKMLKQRTWLVVVIITALLSCLAIGLTGAKYVSELNGTATMQTAKFEVSAEFTGDEDKTVFSLDNENKSVEYPFSVTSNSEVAISYNVIIKLPIAYEGLQFSIGGQSIQTNNNDVEYTFLEDIGGFSANDIEPKNHELIITANDFTSAISLNGISVKVVATQIQPE